MKHIISHSRQDNMRRMQAEKLLSAQGAMDKKLFGNDAAALLSDLPKLQIELELQNEELRESRQKLESEKKRYSDLFDFAPVGYFTLDEQGIILKANLAGAEMLGVKSSLPDNKLFTSYLAKDSQDVFYFHRQKIFREREKHRCEIALVKKDGTPWYAMLESMPVADSDGGVSCCRTVVTNITERKRSDEALHRAIRAYRALSNCNKAVLRALDEEELLRKAVRIVKEDCDYCFTWIGFAEHDEGKTVRPVAQAGSEEGYLETARITWEDSERGCGPTGTAIRTGRPVIINNTMTDPSFAPWREEAMRRGYVSAAAIPLRDVNASFGALTVYATTVDTFTGEEMSLLQELADNLAYGIVSLRAGKKQVQMESRLLQAQKLEAIGTLAGGIAHDFNNILAAIMGNAEMVQQILPADSTAYQHVTQVLNSSNRAKNLVKQILAFSRKSEEDKQPLEIKRAVEEVLKMLKSTLPATIEIRDNIASDAWITGNVTQLHQVLLNLCTNAFHAMREQSGVLGIDVCDASISSANAGLYHDLPQGDYVQLSITDTGPGIDRKIIARIFDPFFTTKEVGEGTGLGLSVVHGIVKDHRGDITVESTPGQGTVFHVLLPRIEPQVVEKEKLEQPLPGGTERILLVDDEDVIVEVGQRMLGMLGYRVTGARSGAEALDIFKKGPAAFDLVITDYTMPMMTGCELAKELMAVRPDLPVIVCTGYNETISAEKAKNRGIREFLLKPLNLRQMGELVRRVLDKGK